MIRPAILATTAALLSFAPVLSLCAEEETQTAEAKAEMASLIEVWKERLREDPISKKAYWAERAKEDAESCAKAKVEMAQLKERAKGLTATSTPVEVEQALGKVGSESFSVRGKTRTKTWSYLGHGDEDAYLSFAVDFASDNTCKVRVVEMTREQAEAEPKHVLEGTIESFYFGYPSDERPGFACKDVKIDGKAVGRVPFIMTDDRPRITGRMDVGAKVRIVYHGKPDDLVFLDQRALSLVSLECSGLPELTPEGEAAKELEAKQAYEREQKQQPPPPPYKRPDTIFPPEAQKTVNLLKKEIVPQVDYEDVDATVVLEDIRQRLEKLDIDHRYIIRFFEPLPTEPLPLGIEPPEQPKKVKELHLRNVPLFDFMHYFGESVYWGWIVYPDGSIQFIPSVCACGYPRDGRAGHTASF
ncbi:hypothetical protein [Haloferula sp. BvORR071]|uniref:hypothetical protein n=1 Tax=Haloferula sp. BvORR071 TaxID=1396141 RepID=UPI000550D97C|nr:hypothetical protein [Haloferula sp. BvORR071]